MLLIKDEKAAGPIETPQKGRLRQYCCPTMTNCLSGICCLAAFVDCMNYSERNFAYREISENQAFNPDIGCIGQLNLVSSIIVFNWRASKTILSDSSFLCTTTGLINVVRESVFTGAVISKGVLISSKCCTLSCNYIGIRVARCFLNTAAAFKVSMNSVSSLIFRCLEIFA